MSSSRPTDSTILDSSIAESALVDNQFLGISVKSSSIDVLEEKDSLSYVAKQTDIQNDVLNDLSIANWPSTWPDANYVTARISNHIHEEAIAFLSCIPLASDIQNDKLTFLIHPGFDLPKVFRRIGNLADKEGYLTNKVICFRDYDKGIPKLRSSLKHYGIKGKKSVVNIDPQGGTAHIFICVGYDHCITNKELSELIDKCVDAKMSKIRLVLGHYDSPLKSTAFNNELYPSLQNDWLKQNKLMLEGNKNKINIEVISITKILTSYVYYRSRNVFIKLFNGDLEAQKNSKKDIEVHTNHILQKKSPSLKPRESNSNLQARSPSPRMQLHLNLGQPNIQIDIEKNLETQETKANVYASRYNGILEMPNKSNGSSKEIIKQLMGTLVDHLKNIAIDPNFNQRDFDITHEMHDGVFDTSVSITLDSKTSTLTDSSLKVGFLQFNATIIPVAYKNPKNSNNIQSQVSAGASSNLSSINTLPTLQIGSYPNGLTMFSNNSSQAYIKPNPIRSAAINNNDEVIKSTEVLTKANISLRQSTV